MNIEEMLSYPYDPYLILGVARDAEDAAVRKAWKAAGSPTDGPIGQAYRMLRDESSRAKTDLLSPRPYGCPSEALGNLERHPVFLGPGAWFQAVRHRRSG